MKCNCRADLGMAAGITQDNHLTLEGFNQGMKRSVRSIGPGTVPRHHQAQVIEQQTELAADNPAMVGFPFAPDLLGGEEKHAVVGDPRDSYDILLFVESTTPTRPTRTGP